MTRRAPLIIGLSASAVVVTACTSGTAPTGPPASSAGSPSVAGSSATAAPPTRSAVPSSTVPRTSSTPSASASQSAVTVRVPTATQAPRSTCRSIMTRVIRGSADRGREFAALQFTNTGTSRCTLVGYPVVTLRRGGAAIGTPSQPAGGAASSFVLAPGATAESRLDDYTNCQAPLSDAIHVVVPGSTQSVTRPGELRACTLRVSALGRPQ